MKRGEWRRGEGSEEGLRGEDKRAGEQTRREERRGEERGEFQPFYLNHKRSFESVSLIMRKGRFRDAEGNSEEQRGPESQTDIQTARKTHKHTQTSL